MQANRQRNGYSHRSPANRQPAAEAHTRQCPPASLLTMFLISMFSCARLVMASAARRATPPLPLRALAPAVAAAEVHSPVLEGARDGGLLMLCAASSLTRPGGRGGMLFGAGQRRHERDKSQGHPKIHKLRLACQASCKDTAYCRQYVPAHNNIATTTLQLQPTFSPANCNTINTCLLLQQQANPYLAARVLMLSGAGTLA